jgi:hypothetical protein
VQKKQRPALKPPSNLAMIGTELSYYLLISFVQFAHDSPFISAISMLFQKYILPAADDITWMLC